MNSRLDRCYLEITNACNLNCAFCAGHDRPVRRMSVTEFDQLTDKLVGRVRFLFFHLMGEPTMHPSLPEFIAEARSKGFIPVLTTNGTLLDSSKGDLLLQSPLYKVNISLHSFEGNGFSGPESYIDSVMRFAVRAASAGIIAVLRLWNQGGFDSANTELLQLIGQHVPTPWTQTANGFKLADRLFLEYDSMFDWPELPVATVESTATVDSSLKVSGSGLVVELPEASAPASASKEFTDNVFCYALRNQIGVLADGTVVPCCLDHNGNMRLGNLFDSELEEILSSPRARQIYDGFTRHQAIEPLCRHCGYANLTKHYHR